MKILHVNPYPPNHFGGSEIFCKNLAIQLNKKKNYECDILTSNILNEGKKFDFLNDSIKVFYKRNYFNLWGKNPVVNIYPFIKKNYMNYDLFHVHSYIFFTSLQCAILRKLREFPLILHLHGGVRTANFLSLSRYENLQLLFKNSLFDKIIGRFTIKNADAIISVSNDDLEIIKQRYNNLKNNCYYIPNAIDTNKFKYEQGSEKKFVTFIGRLTYIKGIDIFIKLISKLYKSNNNLKFLIVGDGLLRNIVKEAMKKLPITYLPYFPYDQIEKIYNISKMIVLTSRFEGLPTSLLESLSCETPVAATNVGGISEVIFPDKNGILFENNNYNKNIQEILSLLNDENKLKEFGKYGRKLIEKKYSWDIIIDKIENIYREIINNLQNQ